MKQWITLVAAAAIFASCTKENLKEESIEQSAGRAKASALRVAQDGAFVSDWEQYANWERTDEGDFSTFSINRKTPEVTSGVTNGGLVLSYGKFSSNEAAYAPFSNPKMMPFYFMPEAERPRANTHYFAHSSSNADISVAYRVPATKEELPAMGGGASLPAMKFQYVVMDKNFLSRHGLDAETVRNTYTYEQVMALLNR